MRSTSLTILGILACSAMAWGIDPDTRPLVPFSLIAAPAETPSPTHAQRVRPFRIQPGFLTETPWLSPDDPVDPNPEGITLSLGNDNPYFDFRRPGDPGGVGYTRLASQLAIFQNQGTSCTLCLGAVSPSGQQYDGLPDSQGPTVVMPALSVFHSLDEGMGVQVSVGGNLTVMTPTPQMTRRDLRYGLSLYRSLGTDPVDPFRNVYVSLEAMGQGRDPILGRSWDVLPGLTWQPASNWTVSGALAVPMAPRPDQPSQQWRIMCTLQY